MNNAEFSPSRRAWNRFFTAAVWGAAALVIVLVAGIIAMVLARGIPHIRVEFLTTTASVLKGTDGILPAIQMCIRDRTTMVPLVWPVWSAI